MSKHIRTKDKNLELCRSWFRKTCTSSRNVTKCSIFMHECIEVMLSLKWHLFNDASMRHSVSMSLSIYVQYSRHGYRFQTTFTCIFTEQELYVNFTICCYRWSNWESTLVYVMAWCRIGSNPLSVPLLSNSYVAMWCHQKGQRIPKQVYGAETKRPPFCKRHFWMHLLELKCLNFVVTTDQPWFR